MHILKITKIIGVLIITILIFNQAPSAHAIYSPKLNKIAIKVIKDIRAARQQNGVGSLQNAWDKVNQQNKVLKDKGQASGTPGLYSTYTGNVKENKLTTLRALGGIAATSGISFVDSLALIFITILDPFTTNTVCWRDDIWALQALQEEVVNEMFKAGLLNDSVNGNILWQDYRELDRQVTDLKNKYRDTKLWFEPGQQNYYVDCPYGEFTQAFEKLSRSWDNLKASFSGDTTSDWGSLYVMAQQNAKRKAAQYVEANKLSLTFGGEAGANPRNLTKQPGLEVDLKVGAEYAKSFGSLVYDSIVGIFKGVKTADLDKIITTYNRAKESQAIAEKQVETNIRFNLQLGNVAEENLIGIERTLSEINATIQRTSEDAAFKACKKLKIVLDSTGKNKGPTSVSCSE